MCTKWDNDPCFEQYMSQVNRVTLYLRSSFSMMYPQGPQLYTQSFPELPGSPWGGGVEEEHPWGGVNSSKMAGYFLKPIMQGGSWLCQTCLVPFISQYLYSMTILKFI